MTFLPGNCRFLAMIEGHDIGAVKIARRRPPHGSIVVQGCIARKGSGCLASICLYSECHVRASCSRPWDLVSRVRGIVVGSVVGSGASQAVRRVIWEAKMAED